MASNFFGNILRITTFGESHGLAMGVVIDGCPAGLNLTVDDINQSLALRAPGKSALVSPRSEPDRAQILSGVFENQTTGAPIAIIIANSQADSSKYEPIKHLLRPGHANYTYSEKYGVYDYRGSGRASARETVSRVAAGTVAMKILEHFNIQIVAYLKSVGEVTATIEKTENMQKIRKVEKTKTVAEVDITQINLHDAAILKTKILNNIIYCPNEQQTKTMINIINDVKEKGDSIGGMVEFVIVGLPVGLGDPIYEKFSAKLASAMFSIPAVKGFEIGEGFRAAHMRGSENNDLFCLADNNYSYNQDNQDELRTAYSSNQNSKKCIAALASNHAGGLLGGITTSMPVIGRVAFKPTPTIAKPQTTVDCYHDKEQILCPPPGSKHDPCVAIRAVIVVEAMCALVTADAILMNRCAKI